MSLRINFRFLDEEGTLKHVISVGSTYNFGDLDHLNRLRERLNDFMTSGFYANRVNDGIFTNEYMVVKKFWKYAVPTTVDSYMFDLNTGQLLTNRFK